MQSENTSNVQTLTLSHPKTCEHHAPYPSVKHVKGDKHVQGTKRENVLTI